ncbi:hypothetical protein GIB67_031559, partial [Kingdonia uniflora]
VTPVIGAPAIGSSSFATEIGAVVVRVCSQLEEHDKMLHNHGKMLEQILMSLPLGDTPLLGQYQLSTPEKTAKRKRERDNEKDDRKRKKAEPRTKKGKGEWQKKVEEADVPNKTKKVEGLKKEAFTNDQFDHVPLIQLKSLIPKILNKGLANRVPRKIRVEFPELENIQLNIENLLQQVVPGEGLDVTMAVAKVVKTDIVFFNQEKVVGEAYQSVYLKANADHTTDVSVEEQTLEIEKTEDKASQASAYQTITIFIEEQTIEVAQTEVVISHQEEDVGKASQTKKSKEEVEQNKKVVLKGKDDDDGNSQNKLDPEQLVLMESKVDVTLKKRHTQTEEEINERAVKMACQMNRLHAHLKKNQEKTHLPGKEKPGGPSLVTEDR